MTDKFISVGVSSRSSGGSLKSLWKNCNSLVIFRSYHSLDLGYMLRLELLNDAHKLCRLLNKHVPALWPLKADRERFILSVAKKLSWPVGQRVPCPGESWQVYPGIAAHLGK